MIDAPPLSFRSIAPVAIGLFLCVALSACQRSDHRPEPSGDVLPSRSAAHDTVEVRQLVERFGERMKRVSLLAPQDRLV